MKRNGLIIGLVLIFLLITVNLVGAEDPKSGGILRIGLQTDPIQIDPAMMGAMENHRFVHILYPGMLKYNEQLQLVLDLAESYEILDDRTYIFKIREGVLFHNGREVTVDDIIYSIERILDPEVISPEAYELEPIEELIKIDDYTIQIITKEPFAPILHALTFGLGVHPREKVEEWGDLRFRASGTRAFSLLEYEPDNYVYLERFDGYYEEGKPYLDRVEYIYMPDDRTRATAIQAGDIHVTRFDDPKAVIPLRRDPNLVVEYTGAPKILHFHLNTTRKPFDDVRVRRAMSYGLDRQAIVDLVFLGDAKVTGPIPPSMTDWALDVLEFSSYRTNQEKAKEMLAEAGYPDGFQSTLMVASTMPIDIQIAQVVKEQLAEIGIEMEIQIREWGDLLDQWIVDRNFDTFFIFSMTGRDPDANFYRRFHSESSRNTGGYSNPYLDSLMDKARVTVDYDERYQLYAEIQSIIVHDSPKLFIMEFPYYEVYRKEVKGWVTHPMGIHYHLDGVWLDQ